MFTPDLVQFCRGLILDELIDIQNCKKIKDTLTNHKIKRWFAFIKFDVDSFLMHIIWWLVEAKLSVIKGVFFAWIAIQNPNRNWTIQFSYKTDNHLVDMGGGITRNYFVLFLTWLGSIGFGSWFIDSTRSKELNCESFFLKLFVLFWYHCHP